LGKFRLLSLVALFGGDWGREGEMGGKSLSLNRLGIC
jgi:hypothetical protein